MIHLSITSESGHKLDTFQSSKYEKQGKVSEINFWHHIPNRPTRIQGLVKPTSCTQWMKSMSERNAKHPWSFTSTCNQKYELKRKKKSKNTKDSSQLSFLPKIKNGDYFFIPKIKSGHRE